MVIRRARLIAGRVGCFRGADDDVFQHLHVGGLHEMMVESCLFDLLFVFRSTVACERDRHGAVVGLELKNVPD